MVRLNQILKLNKNNEYQKNDLLMKFLEKNDLDHQENNDTVYIPDNVRDIIYKYFYDKINVGDVVFIPKEQDLWKTNEKRYIITRKCLDDGNYCVVFNKIFSKPHTDNTIFIGYIQLDQRQKKLERLLK